MKIRVSPRLASFLALTLIAMIGIFLIIRATPNGLGLSDDSIAYIAGARSMLAGQGYREAWLASDQPVTHFPPAFSSVLAFLGLFGIDPLRSVRWVNALLFGLNASLLGILGWRMTRSLIAGLVLAAFFVISGEMFQVHAVAMSEPLFIFLSLLSFWMFDLYFERDHHWLWLVACGTFAGMAYLTRYAGLALVATFVVALLILHQGWRKRLTSIGLFLESVLPWVLCWSIRNRLVAGNATNRTFAWHPLTAENINPGLRVFSEFFIPIASWQQEILKRIGLVEGLIIIVLGLVFVWVIVTAWKHLSSPQPVERGKKAPEVISFTTGLFIFAYLASIIASMLMFDAATKFKLRILAPVLVSLLILLVAFGVWMRGRRREVVIALTVLILGISIYKQSVTINTWAKNGLGYASFQWYDSKAMAVLRGLSEDMMIYTNEPGAVYLYTGRGCYVLPDRFDSATALVRTNFEKGITIMQTNINSGKAVLALFDHGDNVSNDVPALTAGLYLTHKSAGDLIYTAKP
ncbi:MAG TPA: phospholipid carrier-dependent glycosyltransferase [Anaerolineales bacterium]|nr:phospholipid carrier-dependent glycosyltransferase [Anaerolineales bacterium]